MVLYHAADLHLDSPMRGPSRHDGTEEFRGATRKAFSRIVDHCRADRAAALFLAGDVFDSDTKDVRTGLFLLAELARLAEVGTRVYMVRGNHDSAHQAVSAGLSPPPHVTIFGHGQAATVVDEARGLAVHGLSYASREAPTSLLPLYPPPVPGLLNIGLLHTNAVGSSAHAAYAPTSFDALLAHGYDYWALGHVHEAMVHRAGGRWVVYPGNPQGRSMREVGPRGCVRIEVEPGTREIRSVERVIVDVARWDRVTVEVGSAGTAAEVHARVAAALDIHVERAEGRPLACRLVLDGQGEGHRVVHQNVGLLVEQLRSDAAARVPAVWLERVQLATRPAEGDTPEHGLRAELDRAAAALLADPGALVDLLAEDREALERVLTYAGPQADEPPAEDIPRLSDPEWLRALVEPARHRARRALVEEM